MKGWIEQWYVYVPGVVNVREYVSSVCNALEEYCLSSAVTSCAVLSLFVQITCVPAAMSNVTGVKRNPAI